MPQLIPQILVLELTLKKDVPKTFVTALKNAKNAGMSFEGLQSADTFLKEFRRTFRIKLGPDSPSKIEPLQITFRKNIRPVGCTQRRYGKGL